MLTALSFKFCAAIVITIITPFEDTLFNGKGGLILQVRCKKMLTV